MMNRLTITLEQPEYVALLQMAMPSCGRRRISSATSCVWNWSGVVCGPRSSCRRTQNQKRGRKAMFDRRVFVQHGRSANESSQCTPTSNPCYWP